MSGRPSWKSAETGPFSPFFCLCEEHQKTEEKGLFPQISSGLLKLPSPKHPFAALQIITKKIRRLFFPCDAITRYFFVAFRGFFVALICLENSVWAVFRIRGVSVAFSWPSCWGFAKGSSISYVAKLKDDKKSEWKLSNGWSRSYREIKLPLSAG